MNPDREEGNCTQLLRTCSLLYILVQRNLSQTSMAHRHRTLTWSSNLFLNGSKFSHSIAVFCERKVDFAEVEEAKQTILKTSVV